MLLRDYQHIDAKDLRGPWFSNIEVSDVPLGYGTIAKNISYSPGRVQTRLGFAPATGIFGGRGNSMENWVHTNSSGFQNRLITFEPSGGLISWAIGGSGAGTQIIAVSSVPTANYAGIVPAGLRLYASFNQGGIIPRAGGAPLVYSTEEITTGAPYDAVAPTPPSYTNASTQAGGSGNITPGNHNFGALFTSRTGFSTLVTNTGTAVQVTAGITAAGTGAITVTFTPTAVWPAWAKTAQLYMTPTTNPIADPRLVPGAIVDISALGGLSTPFSIVANISDAVLLAAGESALDFANYAHFDAFSSTQLPFHNFLYGSRMVWLGQDTSGNNVAYVSEPNSYQSFSLDEHVLYTSGQQQLTTGFVLYNTLYLLGPHATYQTADTGDVPATWPQPQLVDAAVGTTSPYGVTTNPALGVAWVASADGLQLFQGGTYALLPVSYYQESDWLRINWAVPPKVVDDKHRQRVHVTAALDGATAYTHDLCWDYARGLNASQVNYSLNSFSTPISIGVPALVMSPGGADARLWFGASRSGSTPYPQTFLRESLPTDPTPYRDWDYAIVAEWQSSLFPPISGDLIQHHADYLRMSGAGTPNVSIVKLDGTILNPVSSPTLSATPGKVYLVSYNTKSEGAMVDVQTAGGLDDYFQLSSITHFFSPWVTNR